MKGRLSFVAIVLVVLGLSIGTVIAYASQKNRVDLSGDWYLWVFHSSNQYWLSSLNTDVEGNPAYVLKQDGDKLIGIGKGKFGELSVQGVIKGNDFVMKGTIGKLDAYLTGSFEENRISGKIMVGFDEADFMMKRK